MAIPIVVAAVIAYSVPLLKQWLERHFIAKSPWSSPSARKHYVVELDSPVEYFDSSLACLGVYVAAGTLATYDEFVIVPAIFPRISMRWPLRSQLVWPLLAVVLAAITAVSALNALWADRAARAQVEQQLQNVARTLAEASFPLTGRVLAQTRELSGVDLSLYRESGELLATSDARFDVAESPEEIAAADEIRLQAVIQLNGENYFHAAARLSRQAAGDDAPLVLHLFYPERALRAARWQATLPPVIVGCLAAAIVAALASMIAGRVTRPIALIQEQLADIAAGDYRTLPLPQRNDELRDLAATINRLTEMLQEYETQIRGHERLRTLEQLGGGIAHQMRNAATGCRLALDLHARECPIASHNENLAVATRQLRLMERYLQRFLNQGHFEAGPCESLSLAALVIDTAELVRPLATHHRVRLTVGAISPSLSAWGRREGLEQVLTNLLINGLEAATEAAERTVGVECGVTDHDEIRLEVSDSGPGPAVTGDKVFEPFFTDKPSGTGLGLAVAREIVLAHHGRISWERRGERTVFIVELPRPANISAPERHSLPASTPVA